MARSAHAGAGKGTGSETHSDFGGMTTLAPPANSTGRSVSPRIVPPESAIASWTSSSTNGSVPYSLDSRSRRVSAPIETRTTWRSTMPLLASNSGAVLSSRGAVAQMPTHDEGAARPSPLKNNSEATRAVSRAKRILAVGPVGAGGCTDVRVVMAPAGLKRGCAAAVCKGSGWIRAERDNTYKGVGGLTVSHR